MRARRYTNAATQRATVQAISNLANVGPGYGIIAMEHNRIQTSHRNIPFAPGYGSYGQAEMSPGAAVALGVGGLILTGVVLVGGYLLVAYAVGWGASKGWQRAKRKK